MLRPARRLLAAVAVTTLAVTLPLLSGVTAPAAASTSSSAAAGTVNPPVLWYSLTGTPSDADLRYAAEHVRVVVLNAWDGDAAAYLNSLNPAVTVLAYKDLASTRRYAAQHSYEQPSGVRYQDAPEAWFAHDSSGNRIQWGDFDGHYQMATWNTAYQNAWADRVTAEIAGGPFDGIVADNALRKDTGYFTGTYEAGKTSADVQAGVEAIVNKAGAKLNAAGRTMVVNVTEGRNDLGFWERMSRYGGGAEEQFVHWGERRSEGLFWDWGTAGWADQVKELQLSPMTLTHTTGADDDELTFDYGLASFYLGGGGVGAFTMTGHNGDIPVTQLRPEQFWDLGSPTSAMTKRSNGTYWRSFTDGYAVVNPTRSTQTVPLPSGLHGADGPVGTSLTLPAQTGRVLRDTPAPGSAPAPAPAPTPAPAPAEGGSSFTLVADGVVTGTTRSDGRARATVPSDVRTATISLGADRPLTVTGKDAGGRVLWERSSTGSVYAPMAGATLLIIVGPADHPVRARASS